MKSSTASFLISLLVLALAALLLAFAMLRGRPEDLAGAGAGIAAGALSVTTSFFVVRGRLGGSNLRFLRAFFAGLLVRVLVLVAAGLLVRELTDWSLRHLLIAVGLSYPLYLMLEGWVLSRSLPRPRTALSSAKNNRTMEGVV